ncbi:MAG: hypothetical protein ACRDXX_14890 [Stackebrandtia sp.]
MSYHHPVNSSGELLRAFLESDPSENARRGLLGVPVTGKLLWRLAWMPLVVAGAVWLAFRLADRYLDFWQLWLLALTALVAVAIVRAQRVPAETTTVPAVATTQYIADKPFATVMRWEERMSWGSEDAERFHHTVQRRIAELVAERLRLRRGVLLDADPAAARAALGEQLYRLATEPVSRPLNPNEIENVVRRIEEI